MGERGTKVDLPKEARDALKNVFARRHVEDLSDAVFAYKWISKNLEESSIPGTHFFSIVGLSRSSRFRRESDTNRINRVLFHLVKTGVVLAWYQQSTGGRPRLIGCVEANFFPPAVGLDDYIQTWLKQAVPEILRREDDLCKQIKAERQQKKQNSPN